MKNYIGHLFSIVPAVILLQTLFYKFTGHPESVAIFMKLGVEPWGRILLGSIELVAGILLIIPGTRFYGSIIAIVIMLGAVFSHIFILGTSGAQRNLFILALITLACSLITLYFQFKMR
jgi:UPF0716 family protein affecting phage T7 exclusion